MILNFGKYIYNDGILGIGNKKPQVINITHPTDTSDKGNSDMYRQYQFNQAYYNQLLNSNQYQAALDYISKYKPTDPERLKTYEADVASLRQKAKYDENLKANMTPDQFQQYTFANGVFQDGGLDGITDNQYINQFANLKKLIGSTIDKDENGNYNISKEATALGLFFPSTKRSFLGIDALSADSSNGIDNFLSTYNLTKGDLSSAGVNIEYNEDGSAYLKFDKSNGDANKLLYNYIQYIRDNWDDTEYDAAIRGYDEDGNIISDGAIPFSYQFQGWRDGDWGFEGVNNLVNSVNNLYESATGINTGRDNYDYLTKDALAMYLNMIDNAQNVTKSLDNVEQESLNYSSIEMPFLSDDMQQYIEEATAAGIDPEKLDTHLANMKKECVEIAAKTMASSDKEIYTSYYNAEEGRPNDDTLVPLEDDEKRKHLFDLLSEAPNSKIHLTTLVSNGKIGTKITLDKQSGKSSKSDDEDDDSGSNEKVEIWIPNLFSEEAQRRLNTEPESRAVLEANTIIDTNSIYNLGDGSQISFVKDLSTDDESDGTFIIRSGRVEVNGKTEFLHEQEITKEDVVGHITKDLLIDQAIDNQFMNHVSAAGDVMDYDMFDLSAKKQSLDIANRLIYTGDDYYWFTNLRGEELPVDKLFDGSIDKKEVSDGVYTKAKLVDEIYERLIKDLYTYYDINDILLKK